MVSLELPINNKNTLLPCCLCDTIANVSFLNGCFEKQCRVDRISYSILVAFSILNEVFPSVLECLLRMNKIFNKSSSYIPSLFHDSLRTDSSLHYYNTRHASKGNFRRPKVRTNTGKLTFVYAAWKLWETLPTNLKRLSIKSVNPKISRIGRQKRKNEFLAKRTHLVTCFRK